jgi:hypothetical protein
MVYFSEYKDKKRSLYVYNPDAIIFTSIFDLGLVESSELKTAGS